MTDTKERLAEVLRKAIRGEQQGYRFYDLLSKKAADAEAKRKLEHLRDDEIRHEKTLIHMFKTLVGPDIGALPQDGIGPLAQAFSEDRLADKKTEIEFIDLAIETELAATEFYQRELETFSEPEFRAVFNELAEEEHSHYELLKAERDALSGGHHWFSYDAGAPLED